MAIEVGIILLLLVANGIFAMAEIALLSSRKARLQQRAEDGDRKAATALALANDPNDFLSTVQVGITLVGILAGAFGGASLADRLGPRLDSLSWIAPHGQAVAMTFVVAAITYFSLIIGELVPKRLALTNPEGIASAMAPFMRRLSRLALPAVRLLSISSDLVMRVFGVRDVKEAPITEEELRLLIRQGTQAGTFEKAEQEIVERVFAFGDRPIGSFMTPRPDIVWIDVNASAEEVARTVAADPHGTFPVADRSLDSLSGVLLVNDLLVQVLTGNPIDLRKLVHPALMLPEGLTVLEALDSFKHSSELAAIVINEHGGVEGLLTLDDLVSEIVGHGSDPLIIQRGDGSWLVDGTVTTAEFSEHFRLKEFPAGTYQTIGGFVMTEIGRVPRTSDHFEWGDFRFEVMDMDRNRVDKVLVSHRPGAGPASPHLEGA